MADPDEEKPPAPAESPSEGDWIATDLTYTVKGSMVHVPTIVQEEKGHFLMLLSLLPDDGALGPPLLPVAELAKFTGGTLSLPVTLKGFDLPISHDLLTAGFRPDGQPIELLPTFDLSIKERFPWTPGMGTLNGKLDDYELALRHMIYAALAWFEEHPTSSPAEWQDQKAFEADGPRGAISRACNLDANDEAFVCALSNAAFVREHGWTAFGRVMGQILEYEETMPEDP